MFHVRSTGKFYDDEVRKITTLCGKKVSKANTISAVSIRIGVEKNDTGGKKVCKRCREFAIQGY